MRFSAEARNILGTDLVIFSVPVCKFDLVLFVLFLVGCFCLPLAPVSIYSYYIPNPRY